MTSLTKLNPADGSFREKLSHKLPKECFREFSAKYSEDPRGAVEGLEGLVIAPGSVEEVSTTVALCADCWVPIVPFGGGTGLVGGQLTLEGPTPVILSMERMTSIRRIYDDENVMVVEAGAILADIQNAAAECEKLFPLSLAAEGTCRIGGNLATNAGGVNVVRYGNTRDLCLGLEAVLPDGQIWNGLTRLHKDNTGYDLRNLLIGSEGTLGVITAASLKLFPIPEQTATAILVVNSPEAALTLFSDARRLCGGSISAFEIMHRTGLDFLKEKMSATRLPFSEHPEWMVLIELGLPKSIDAEEILMELFELGLENGLVEDGLIAQSGEQRKEFWCVRENIPEANRMIGTVATHDISLPLSAVPIFIDRSETAIAKVGEYRINCFGHLGDGNLHYNIFPPAGESKEAHLQRKPEIERIVYELVSELNGSFSAEHGIGRTKVKDLKRYGDPAKILAMQAIKTALDPSGIMNPGVILN